MVVTGNDVKLPALLKTLESATIGIEEKVEAYQIFSDQLQEDELSFFDLDITYYIEPIVSVLHQDILHHSELVQQGALQVLGFCLHDLELVRLLPVESQKKLVGSLCKCLKNAEDKSTCTRGLWVLSKQNIQPDLIAEELDNIMSSITHCLTKWKGQAQTVEYEAVNAIARLNALVNKEMREKTKWEKICLGLLIHPAAKVREKALITLEKGCETAVNKNTVKEIIPEVKSKIIAELKRMFVGNELFVLRAWSFLVKYFGEELHHGGFINILLPIAETGFKRVEPEYKMATFRAWKILIDNFATNPNIITDPKRVKLVMQVFKVNNAKTEGVAVEKFNTWVYFVRNLGSKISVNFEQVLAPLLQFCTGGNKLASSSTPTTPRFGIMSQPTSPAIPRINISSTPSNLVTFKVLQLKGMEVLARILGEPLKSTDYPRYNFSIDPFVVDIITSPLFFLKQSVILISCFRELVTSLGSEIPESLLLYTWQALIGHVHVAVDMTPKSDHRQMFSYFLSQFQVIACHDALSAHLVKMFEPVCGLPYKVLSSNVYSVGNGEGIMGTPALSLCEILLSPVLLSLAAEKESFMTLYGKLIDCGMNNPTGTLEFSHGVLDIIDRHVESLPTIELLWRLWSVIANRLLEHIIKTSEINQGDSLEYDFTCIYTALLLPVKHKIGSLVSQPVCKSLMKTWSDLYKCFVRESALVTTARDNVVCEDFMSKIINSLTDDELKEIGTIDFLVQILQVVVDSVNFSSLSASSTFNIGGTFSPGKRWLKHKQKPLENLHSFISLLTDLLTHSVDISDNGYNPNKKSPSISVAVNGLVDIVSTLVTHVSSSSIISNMFEKIAEPLSRLFLYSSNRNGNKLYTPSFYQKLEKLWLDISICLQSRYNSIYDSDFLHILSPLLIATFSHPRRPIKNQTILLWNSTFGRSSMLNYPDKLKVVLAKVKEKTPLSLPGWLSIDTTTIIDDTPASQSQFSQMDAPEPHLPGLPSPHKFHGSFLNKAVSPNVKKSPAKLPVMESRNVASAKKKLAIDGLTNNDYVVIKSSPKKSRILTEHQRESMKQKSVIPAMYNNLDQSQSQDISMMSQFQQDTQPDLVVSSTDSEVIVIPSSQSESSQSKEMSEQSQAQNEDSEAEPEITFKQPIKTRRRSVRFSWDADDEKVQDKTQGSGSVAKNNTDISVKSESLSSSSASLKQNLEGAVGIMDQTFESVSNKSSSSSLENKENKIDIFDSSESVLVKNNSQDSDSQSINNSPQTVFSQIRSFSQSPQRSRLPSPKRKSNSQEIRSSSRSPKRKSISASYNFSLDKWVVKSPSKSLASGDDLKANDSISSQVLVEDTQSPTKFKDASAKSDSGSKVTPNRNLFDANKPSMVAESPEIVPDSPELSAVVKVHKLTDSDIKKYSQENAFECSMDENMQNSEMFAFSENKVNSSQGFETASKSQSLGFFSQEKTLSQESSQAIPSTDDSVRGISGILTAEQKEQLNDCPSTETEDSIFSAATQSQSILRTEPSSVVHDVDMAEEISADNNMKYDPTTTNTLKDTISQETTVLENDEDDQTPQSSQSSESESSQCDGSYDPTKISTLNEDNAKKKRKQATPKKSPLSITPRRTPRRHKKRRHSNCDCCSAEEDADRSTLKSISEEKNENESQSKNDKTTEISQDEEKLKETINPDINKLEGEQDPSNLVSDSRKDEFTEDLISETMEAAEQTPEGKTTCKEIRRKSTTKEKLAVAKRRSAKLSEEGNKSRKQLDENSDANTTVDKEEGEANIETCLPDPEIKQEMSDTNSNNNSGLGKDLPVAPCENLSDLLVDSQISCSQITEDSKASSQESMTFSASASKDFPNRSTRSASKRKNRKTCSPKTNRLRSSGLVIQTRTLRDGKKITLAKLSPVAKRVRKRAKKNRSVSESDAGNEAEKAFSDTESEMSEKSEIANVDSARNVSKTDSQKQNDSISDNQVNDVFGELINSNIKQTSNDSKQDKIFDKITVMGDADKSDETLDKSDNIKIDNVKLIETESKDKSADITSIDEQIIKVSKTLVNPVLKDSVDGEKVSRDAKEKAGMLSPIPQEETPKKFKGSKKRSLSGLVNSDSKVIGLNRLGFKSRGFNIVRRSILQQRNMSDDQSKTSIFKTNSLSPSRSFSSITASPSTSILKRRLSVTDIQSNSPSPPAKQRRVSFATPIVEGKSPVKYQEVSNMPPSPLITNSFTQLTCSGNKYLVGSPSYRKKKSRMEKEIEDSESQTSQSQPFKCTDESELKVHGPAFPEFIDCDEPVEKILPQLTSSLWSRGLVQLIRSNVKNIISVGDLCRLSEYEINNLPIRQPKLPTLQKALSTLEYKKNKDTVIAEKDNECVEEENVSMTYSLPTVVEDEECDEELPSADEALQKLADATPQVEDCDADDALKLSQSSDSDQSTKSLQLNIEDQSHSSATIPNLSALEPDNLLDIVKEISQSGVFDNLNDIRTGTLFQVHQHLTSFTNKVVAAIQSKCQSPSNTQE
ncbi:hypothetical protein SNE40_022753 [Patella caerulea]|uniref:Telomere-associated protein Rif1 N-terminal domain-containing protein n=1 Tax=Patella caerulea TaxID=87958 RepID=A0AAN8IXY7_PATCE